MTDNIAIIDCGIGNNASIKNMLKKAGCSAIITLDKEIIEAAKKIILPGIGTFDRGMSYLEKKGLIPILTKQVLKNKKPLLGICLGMQLLMKSSQEGNLKGLGFLDGEVKKFSGKDPNIKIPHMGWNTLDIQKQDCILFAQLPKKPRFYFVHSYFVDCRSTGASVANAHHGETFTAVIEQENIFGVQFHPEKSHRFGIELLKSFAKLPC